MKNFLEQKIVIEKTVGQMLRSTLIGSIIFIIILFNIIYFSPADSVEFLEGLISVINHISTGELSIFNLFILVAPMFIIFFLTIRFGLITMYLDKGKNKKNF